jgi:hypothetical protein
MQYFLDCAARSISSCLNIADYNLFCPIRSGSQQLTSGFSGANIGMASAQPGGQ